VEAEGFAMSIADIVMLVYNHHTRQTVDLDTAIEDNCNS
jgi:hypothetical protein